MDYFILNNPYKVLGVLSSNTPREIERNISKFKAFIKIKKTPTSDYDFKFLNKTEIDRTESNISKSQNLVVSDRTKIQYSLFWFANGNAFDKIAIENLKKGEYKKAIEVWKKCTQNKKILKSNFTSFNNYSSLLLNLNFYLYTKDNINFDEIKNAIQIKYDLISSNQFSNFNSLINAEKTRLSIGEVKEMFSEDLIKILKNNFNNSKISEIFQGVDDEIYQSFSGSLTKEPIQSISNAIDVINNDLEKDHNKGLELGKKLIKLTLKDVKNLKELVGDGNYEFQMICDKLANQIMECGIRYYNKTYDDQDFLSSYKYALSISYSEKTKTRAKDTIKHCLEEKEKNICSKCNMNQIDKANPKVIRIYKETSRSWWNRSVQYQYVDLNVHFCSDCKSKSDADGNYGCASMIGAAVLGGLISQAASGDDVGWIGGAIIGLVIGWIIKLIAFPDSNIAAEHPTVKKYQSEGWSTSKPQA